MNSAPSPAGRKRSTGPLTDSTDRVARPESPASNRTPPDTDSSAARSNEPPETSRRPLTVEASSSPEASRTVTVPLTASALRRPVAFVDVDRPVHALELDSLRRARLGDRAVDGLRRDRAGDAGDRDRGLEALDRHRAAGRDEDLEVALDAHRVAVLGLDLDGDLLPGPVEAQLAAVADGALDLHLRLVPARHLDGAGHVLDRHLRVGRGGKALVHRGLGEGPGGAGEDGGEDERCALHGLAPLHLKVRSTA